MSENPLRKIAKGEIVSGASDAIKWANDLVRRETRGPGDIENAMRRLESRYGISWRTFWELRYRPPADVMTGVYQRLNAAYLSEIERQEAMLRHEREITKAKGMFAAALVRAADALACQEDQ